MEVRLDPKVGQLAQNETNPRLFQVRYVPFWANVPKSENPGVLSSSVPKAITGVNSIISSLCYRRLHLKAIFYLFISQHHVARLST